MILRESYHNFGSEIVILANGAQIFPGSIVLAGADLGEGVRIQSLSFVESGAVIGADTTIRPHSHIPSKVEIGVDTFVAGYVKFIDHLKPKNRCAQRGEHPWLPTYIGNDVSIGIGSTIFPVRVGDGAMIGAASLIMADVPEGMTVKGIWKGER